MPKESSKWVNHCVKIAVQSINYKVLFCSLNFPVKIQQLYKKIFSKNAMQKAPPIGTSSKPGGWRQSTVQEQGIKKVN